VRFNRALIGVRAVSSIKTRIQRAGFLWNVTWLRFRFAPGFDESRLRRSKNVGMRYEAIDSDS
jgi:hypothetical protein